MDFDQVAENIVLELAACRELLADAWVKLPIRWSKVDVGRIIVDERDRLWLVVEREAGDARRDAGQTIHVVVQRIGDTKLYPRDVHAEGQVKILIPGTERDGMLILRKELGAQLMTPEQARDALAERSDAEPEPG
jgi:hypothetical protein